MYRFDGPLFFANADRFAARVRDLIVQAPHPVKWFLFDLVSMGDIDYTGGLMFVAQLKRLHQDGVIVAVTEIEGVRDILDRLGVMHCLAPDRVFDSVQDGLDAYRREIAGVR
jgi:MFS superfamily sulfate permease-like transporter